MRDLKLPVPDRPLPPGRRLSMDEYLRFVQMFRRFRFDQEKHGQLDSLPHNETRFRFDEHTS